MRCPNDGETLVMTERQGVEIDYCPKCRGVWLDKGELDKIIERSAEIQFGENKGYSKDKEYDDDYYKKQDEYYRKQHHPYPQKRRKGFLGDLFDFD